MRILLVKTSSLGDVIHNLPVATDLARRIPGASIDWCVEEGFAQIPALHPSIGRIIPVAIRRWRRHPLSPSTWADLRRFRKDLRSSDYDAIIDTQGLVKSALLARWAHGRRCGYGRDSIRERLAARFYDDTHDVSRQLHAVDRNRRLAAAALGYSLEGLHLDYGLAAPSVRPDWLPAGPYAMCFSATSRDDKLWPEPAWQALLAALAARGLKSVLAAGTAIESERANRIAAGSPHAVAAPKLDLRTLAGVLAGARLAVGVDTGLTHLAAALEVPAIALYVASDPGLTGVLGSAPYANLGRRGQAPQIAEVIQAVETLLG